MIHKESWYKESSLLSKVRQIFDSWGIDPEKIELEKETSITISMDLPVAERKRLRNNLGNIQRDLSDIGWRVVLWKQDYPQDSPEISLALSRELPKGARRSIYYHVTLLSNLQSIQERGLLPFRNYEYVKNPRPAIYLASSLDEAKNSMPDRKGSKIVLQVSISPGIPLYPDPEVAHIARKGSVVYCLHRIPPEFLAPQLNGAIFRGEDLHGWNMAGEEITESTFSRCNLSGMDLRGSNFWRTSFLGSSLSGANLQGSNLMEANLRVADLTGANLRDCNLEHASMNEADLRGADLTGANLEGAYVGGIKLSGAIYDKDQFSKSIISRWL